MKVDNIELDEESLDLRNIIFGDMLVYNDIYPT